MRLGQPRPDFAVRSIKRFVMTLAAFAFITTSAISIQAQTTELAETDWPQWRGANRDDISKETGLLKSWPEGGPTNLWTSDQGGLGYAGFAVVGDRLFTLGADDSEEFVLCMDVADGSVVWKTAIGERFTNGWGDGPRNTPTFNEGKLYCLAAAGNIACLDASDGSKIWSKSLTDDFGGSVPNWGYAESPLVDNGNVMVTPGGDDGAIVALNKDTGEKVWQSIMFTEKAHYSSIVIADHPDKRHYVQLVANAVVGVDPEDGTVLWRQSWPGKVAVIPTPIYDDKSVYVTSGYGVGSKLIDISNLSKVKQAWFGRRMKNHHGGVILVDGHYYGYSDGAGWICQSKETGDMVWNEKDALGKGAIGYADGHFYLLSEKKGEVVLIEATTEGWNEKGRFTLSPQTKQRKPRGAIWVHPVISNGKLFLRDQEMIFCFDVKE